MHYLLILQVFTHSFRVTMYVMGVILLLISYIPLQAQPNSVESITIADGLSQGMIYDIEQTEDEINKVVAGFWKWR